MKKKFILTLIFAAFIAKGFTQISPFWDVGKFSFEGIKNTDSWNAEFNMDVCIFYFVENNTNIYASLSPCRVGLEYDKTNNSNSDVSFPFKMNSLFLVNAEVGWLKFMGDYFLLSPFVRVNTVNPGQINETQFTGGVQLAWCVRSFEPFSSLEYPLLPKIISIETGVELDSITNFNPCFYCSVGLNLGVCFCSLYDVIVKN